jgi:hypothetical protein
MCVSCGCVLAGTGTPGDDHGDGRNITFDALAAAAMAAGGLTVPQAAANIIATVTAAADGMPADLLKAAAGPQRYCLGIAYQPGPDPRIAKGLDGARDFLSEAELEKAAWSLIRNGPRVGMFHADGTDADGGAAQIVESYIYRNDEPWDLGGGVVVTKGTWLVGAILSPRAWELQQAGKITGWSPQGSARRRRRVRQPS